MEAFQRPVLGHLDPDFLVVLDEIADRLRLVMRTNNALTLPVSGTGSAGMEACFVNLLEPGDKPEVILTGRILNEKGTPIPGAVVQFWSCDHKGEYDMISFKYTGYQVADATGRYELTTIIPGAYQPREAKHIHVKVQAISRPVTTQLYFEGEPGNQLDEYYNPDLVITWTKDEDEGGVRHGTFDFVIAQFTDDENVTPETLAARV